MKKEKQREFQSIQGLREGLGKFLIELRLSPLHRELIRALIQAANDKCIFEASASDLAELLYKSDEATPKALSERVKYAVRTLFKWQNEHQVQLIRLNRAGQVQKATDGTKIYLKPQYDFILLRELKKAVSGNFQSLEKAFEFVSNAINREFQPTKKKDPYNPNHSLKKTKATIRTNFRRVFELAVKADLLPEVHCNQLLRECRDLVKELSQERTKAQNRANFINRFEEQCSV